MYKNIDVIIWSLIVLIVGILYLCIVTTDGESGIIPDSVRNAVVRVVKGDKKVVSSNKGYNNFVPNTKEKIERLVKAIWVAEGGHKTNYPYGIKSVKCAKGENGGCKAVAVRTVKNNVKRWKKAVKVDGYKGDYLQFLWERFCPPTAHALNKHWRKNVERGL